MLQDHARGLAADAPGAPLGWTGSMPRRASVRPAVPVPPAALVTARGPRSARRSASRLAAVPLAGALVLALGGCGAASAVGRMTTPADARVYETAAEAAGRIPAWIPADATGIRIKTSLRGDGAILEFRSPTPADRLGCDAAPADVPPPAVQDTWWPDPSPAASMSCGDGWLAAAEGDAVRAWLPQGSPALDL
ncbi:hypothetical protein [Clavibacter zhangzhiyongii]|uniref:hypothetical protein n=1 Tax=Clavibacter zhangzhiyongii TaxID=2768071 RepID=UPI0039E154F0